MYYNWYLLNIFLQRVSWGKEQYHSSAQTLNMIISKLESLNNACSRYCLQLNQKICYWTCISDGCSGEFKSRHCAADLVNSWSKFELHKLVSAIMYHMKVKAIVTIGSIVKSELKRGIFKHPEIEIHSDDAAIDIIRSEVKERTKQLDFFFVSKIISIMQWKSLCKQMYQNN